MFTVTSNKILPCTITGSWPRPRWFDMSMMGRSLDTCMLDVRFRERFQDALATVFSDQERAGIDILTHGDLHCDDDLAGRSWHHYPLQRWTGFCGDYLQSEETRSPWLRYPPGTLLNEIYTGWRWPHVVDKIEHRSLDYAKIWRMAQSKTTLPVRFGTCCSQVMGLFLDIHTPKYKDHREVIWDMAVAMNTELLALRAAGCRCIQIEEPTLHFWANTYGRLTTTSNSWSRDSIAKCKVWTTWKSGSTPAGAIPTCSASSKTTAIANLSSSILKPVAAMSGPSR